LEEQKDNRRAAQLKIRAERDSIKRKTETVLIKELAQSLPAEFASDSLKTCEASTNIHNL